MGREGAGLPPKLILAPRTIFLAPALDKIHGGENMTKSLYEFTRFIGRRQY